MSRSKKSPDDITLRYVGGCGARIWKGGWIRVKPGQFCTFPSSQEETRLATGIWEHVEKPKPVIEESD